MFLVAITNWKKKLFFLVSILLLLTLLVTIIPAFYTGNLVNTDSEPNEEDILSKPIKVQSEPVEQESQQKKTKN